MKALRSVSSQISNKVFNDIVICDGGENNFYMTKTEIVNNNIYRKSKQKKS